MAQAEADSEEGVKAGAEAEATLRLGLPSASARLARHSAAQQRGTDVILPGTDEMERTLATSLSTITDSMKVRVSG